MKVLISGANGFIGRALCPHLFSLGHSVVVAVRSSCGLNGEHIVGDRSSWMQALAGCSSVIHLAGRAHVMQDHEPDPLQAFRTANVVMTTELANRAVEAGVRRFVYISSIKVNGEHSAPNTPFHAEDIPAPEDAYGISKLEAEQGLLALARNTGIEGVIIRPPLVYGPGVKGSFASMVNWVRKGIPLPLGAVHNKRSLVALENLVDFIALCADPERSPRAANEVFLISDGEDVSTTGLLRKVSNAYNVAPLLLPIPISWIQTTRRLLGMSAVADRLLGSLVVDSSKARDLLGWKPVVSMDEQLEKMAFHDSRT